MKRIYTIKKLVAHNTVIAEDSVGREVTLNSDRALKAGQSVLVVNGIVVGRVADTEVKVYEV